MPAKSHGRSGKDPVYRIWANIKQRCTNPNHPRYADYGGRGITLCKRWLGSFEAFLADMGERPSPDHSVDRKNNNRGYSPSNCRWATYTEQARNSRKCVGVKIGKETKPIAAWCEHFGVQYATVKKRRQAGWTLQDALTKPTETKHRRKE